MWFFDYLLLSWFGVIGAAVLGLGYWPVAAILAVSIVRSPSTKTAFLTLILAVLVASVNLSSSGQLATLWLLVAGGYWLLARFVDEASVIITAVVAFVLVIVMDWSRGHTAFLTWILTMGLAMLLDWQMSRQRSQKLRIR